MGKAHRTRIFPPGATSGLRKVRGNDFWAAQVYRVICPLSALCALFSNIVVYYNAFFGVVRLGLHITGSGSLSCSFHLYGCSLALLSVRIPFLFETRRIWLDG